MWIVARGGHDGRENGARQRLLSRARGATRRCSSRNKRLVAGSVLSTRYEVRHARQHLLARQRFLSRAGGATSSTGRPQAHAQRLLTVSTLGRARPGGGRAPRPRLARTQQRPDRGMTAPGHQHRRPGAFSASWVSCSSSGPPLNPALGDAHACCGIALPRTLPGSRRVLGRWAYLQHEMPPTA